MVGDGGVTIHQDVFVASAADDSVPNWQKRLRRRSGYQRCATALG